MTELLRLSLPARPPFVRVARDAVVSLARGLGFTEVERDDLRLAVGEACNNAIEHGADESGTFTLLCAQDERYFIIEVVNAGARFRPKQPARMPDGDAEHGRGRPLMELLVDHVEYAIENQEQVVRLRKRLPSE